MTKPHVELSGIDREQLQELLQKKSVSVQVARRARGLLALDAGQTLQTVAVAVCYLTVAAWRDRYKQEALALLEDRARTGRPPLIDGLQRAKVTELACSTLLEGYTRWSLRLLAAQLVELDIVQSISPKHVATLLKKTI